MLNWLTPWPRLLGTNETPPASIRGRGSAAPMQVSVRIPNDRIAVLIGKGGETRKAIEDASGTVLVVNSQTGDITIDWKDGEQFDPIIQMKLPDLIKAIGRGMSPKRALRLLDDDLFFLLLDMREWVGKQANQQRRMRGRLIGRNGRIRKLIEEHSGCEMAVYGSTIVLVGDEEGLPLASNAVERILRGSEHSTVIKGLERESRERRLRSRKLENMEERTVSAGGEFENLVPGLADARRRQRRYRSSAVDPDDEQDVDEVMELAEDESINWSEE